MGFWSRLSQFLWQERETPAAVAPATPSRPEAAGAPAFLRKTVRVSMIAFAATVLTAGLINVRLVARVDASDGYQACIQNCLAQFQTCPNACTNTVNNALVQCNNADFTCEARCSRLVGAAHDDCVRPCQSRLRCCICLARQAEAACRVKCPDFRNLCLARCTP
jgi:hypothetical protein